MGADGPVVGIAGGGREVCEQCHMDGELWEQRSWDGREASVFESAVYCISCKSTFKVDAMASYLVRA